MELGRTPVEYSYVWYLRKGVVYHGKYIPYESSTNAPAHMLQGGHHSGMRHWIATEGVTAWAPFKSPRSPAAHPEDYVGAACIADECDGEVRAQSGQKFAHCSKCSKSYIVVINE